MEQKTRFSNFSNDRVERCHRPLLSRPSILTNSLMPIFPDRIKNFPFIFFSNKIMLWERFYSFRTKFQIDTDKKKRKYELSFAHSIALAITAMKKCQGKWQSNF